MNEKLTQIQRNICPIAGKAVLLAFAVCEVLGSPSSANALIGKGHVCAETEFSSDRSEAEDEAEDEAEECMEKTCDGRDDIVGAECSGPGCTQGTNKRWKCTVVCTFSCKSQLPPTAKDAFEF